MKKIISLSIILICFLVIALVFLTNPKESEASLISLDNKKIEKYTKEKKNMWIYIGRPTCEECKKFSPVLKETIKENNKSVYYYNTDEAREENEQQMINILDKLKVKSVPTIIHLKNGEVVKKTVGFQDKVSLEELLKD